MNLVFDKDKATLDNVIRPLGWLADGTKSSVGSIVSFPSIPHRKEFSEASQCIINDGFFYEREYFKPESGNSDDSWEHFRSFWDDLSVDQYMADSGTYRLRRYSTLLYKSDSFSILKMPYMPLFKSSDYNSFAGDVYRYFEETDNAIYFNPYFQRVLNESLRVFISCENKHGRSEQKWLIEVDQYRILTNKYQLGKPTPEGVHSDGTNYFTLMLVQREGVKGGISSLYDCDMNLKKEVTLQYPGDTIMLDDKNMLHGVTEIEPIEESGVRDILHISFTNVMRPGSVKRRFGLGSEEIITI